MSEQKKPSYDLEECQREIERGNFHHVNDTDERKTMSCEFCASIDYHLTAAQERIKELEAVELIYKDKQTEMNDLELELQALTVKHDALLSMTEKLVERLKNSTYFQNGAKNYLEHHENCNIEDYDMPDDEACMCGLDNFSHDNHLSVSISKQALTEYEAWKKENLK